MRRQRKITPQKHISVEEVKAAARERSLNLIQQSCGDGKKNACPLAALYLRENEKSGTDFTEQVLDWADTVYGSDYVVGFLDAIDNDECESWLGAKYVAGNEDGMEVRQALWPTQPRDP